MFTVYNNSQTESGARLLIDEVLTEAVLGATERGYKKAIFVTEKSFMQRVKDIVLRTRDDYILGESVMDVDPALRRLGDRISRVYGVVEAKSPKTFVNGHKQIILALLATHSKRGIDPLVPFYGVLSDGEQFVFYVLMGREIRSSVMYLLSKDLPKIFGIFLAIFMRTRLPPQPEITPTPDPKSPKKKKARKHKAMVKVPKMASLDNL